MPLPDSIEKANFLDSKGLYKEADNVMQKAAQELGWTDEKVNLAKSMGFDLSPSGLSTINPERFAKQIFDLICQDYSYEQVLEQLTKPYSREFHSQREQRFREHLEAVKNSGSPAPDVYQGGQKVGWDKYIELALASQAYNEEEMAALQEMVKNVVNTYYPKYYKHLKDIADGWAKHVSVFKNELKTLSEQAQKESQATGFLGNMLIDKNFAGTEKEAITVIKKVENQLKTVPTDLCYSVAKLIANEYQDCINYFYNIIHAIEREKPQRATNLYSYVNRIEVFLKNIISRPQSLVPRK